ncbi:MAG: FixJ family two-component response regulator [Gammaproteobacteria bacterium]|jgi:FixJ family two-component response regulator
MTVLPHIVAIVDDDASVRDALALALSTRGWVPHVYASGEAFFQPNDERVAAQCLVLDLDLPNMNGVELLRRLNAMEWSIPTVVLTADPHGALAQAALVEGAVVVLGKPATYETLTQALENVLNP